MTGDGIRKPRSRRKRWRALYRRITRSARWARRKLAAAPRSLRIAGLVAVLLVAAALTNLVYQVVRKPTELFVLVGHRLDKEPEETWRQYGSLFRKYATSTITPELLAALAQTESSGNPVTRTYWRWQLALNPFRVYKPASSAVGLFQMTDGAFEESSRYCIRDHAVEDEGCGSLLPYIRALPRHAVELTAIYLDRQVASVLARVPDAKPNAQQKQDLATLIHLCGAGPAAAFVRRGFRTADGERCGDHLAAGYLGKVNTMKREFKRLSAEDRD
ncbi:lytic transglycosylase domain-containing protein [Bradyrhizobium sp. HKCCYLS1011]|uniref:lytic transglycosylase domain-containing protein n=1 Tax=Bradyrhizobium sp. HKCCYLS1011 TaxID=3420733 RepID=UPI003EB9FEDD